MVIVASAVVGCVDYSITPSASIYPAVYPPQPGGTLPVDVVATDPEVPGVERYDAVFDGTGQVLGPDQLTQAHATAPILVDTLEADLVAQATACTSYRDGECDRRSTPVRVLSAGIASIWVIVGVLAL